MPASPSSPSAGGQTRVGCLPRLLQSAGAFVIMGAGFTYFISESSRFLPIGEKITAMALWFCVAAVLIFIGHHLEEGQKKPVQAGRNDAAEELFGAISSGAPYGPFVLYLRAFLVTNRMRTSRMMDFSPADHPDAEEALANMCAGRAELVALGQPEEAFGAGRVAVEEAEWKEVVVGLMDAATLILLVPSDRPGTMWEFEQILNRGHLSKTLFLRPLHAASLEGEWKITQGAWLERFGQRLPPWKETELFEVDGNGNYRALGETQQFETLVRRAIERQTPSRNPD